MRKRLFVSISIFILGLCAASAALADWPSDPAVNLPVAVKADEQVQPKVVPGPGGGWYVSWFDNDPTGNPAYGYDVFLQLLDASAAPMWGADGLRIADRGLGWTMDYALEADGAGNALIAFNDDRSGLPQITIEKVDPAGTILWSQTVTRTKVDKGPPSIAILTDGTIGLAWTEGTEIWIKLLNQDGRGIWTKKIVSGKTEYFLLCDIAASSDGGLFVSWQREKLYQPMLQLWANKLSRGGKFQWGSPGIALYDAGELIPGNFPEIIADNVGGAFFPFQTSTPVGDVRAQWVTAGGAELYQHNGLPAMEYAPGQPISPAATFDPASGQAVLVFDVSAGSDLMMAQRFDGAGRVWPDAVILEQSVSPAVFGMTVAVQDGRDTVAFWWDEEEYLNDQFHAVRFDPAGTIEWGALKVASGVSSKRNPAAAVDATGAAVLAWSDQRNDSGDIYAEKVNRDGSLGGP